MKKVGLIVLTLSVAIAVMAFGLHSPMAQQGHESVPQEVAQVRPEGGPPAGGSPGGGPGGDRPAGDFGEPIASTEADTSGVLCDASTNVLNEQLGLQSEAQWSCADGQRQLVANGVPHHQTGGQFVGERNPITAHEVNVALPLNSVARTGAGQRSINPAYALNGVKFNPGTGGRCASNITDVSECSLRPGSTGEWTMEALGQSTFDFGEDANHAHVQRGGVYHYHGMPEGMLSEQNLAGESMQLIAWAVDGFPLYARYGYSAPESSTSALQAMAPSYQLKATPDPDRPSVDLIPMGTFSQDYEYVAGSGDLDECNGRFAVTPEFPQGVYHYYVTDAYPFVQRCVKGTPDPSARRGPAEDGGTEDGGPPDGDGSPGGGGGSPQGNAPPDFSEAAEQLGVSEAALSQAIQAAGGRQADFSEVAEALGIDEADLREALPPRPNR
ncbi:MAG: YHYH protein [Leptolyngbyaceae cyanobacterium]